MCGVFMQWGASSSTVGLDRLRTTDPKQTATRDSEQPMCKSARLHLTGRKADVLVFSGRFGNAAASQNSTGLLAVGHGAATIKPQHPFNSLITFGAMADSGLNMSFRTTLGKGFNANRSRHFSAAFYGYCIGEFVRLRKAIWAHGCALGRTTSPRAGRGLFFRKVGLRVFTGRQADNTIAGDAHPPSNTGQSSTGTSHVSTRVAGRKSCQRTV